jgi:hypothetical protein
MNRRHLLVLTWLFLRRAGADERDDVLQVFVPLASALSSGDAEAFMKPIDQKMAGFEQLRENVYGLIAQFEIKSSIELIRVEGGRAELDWFMELKSREDAGGTYQRRKAITARFEKKRILSIDPIDFFAPVQV